MQYVITFFEGITTFISPCLLPMLPIYVVYFAGESTETKENSGSKAARTLRGAFSFVLGFTFVFVLMGAFAGTIGSFLREYQRIVNIVSGAIVILFGLNFLGLFQIPFFKGLKVQGNKRPGGGIFSSFLFGIVFSVGWTPCVGAFLGSALMLASQQGHVGQGMLLLLLYSLGLGIPFILSAVLIDQLKGAFDFIKRNYKIINIISGSILILVGILMAVGFMGTLLGALA